MKLRIVFVLAVLVMSAEALAEQCTKDFPNHMIWADGNFGLYLGTGGAWWYPCNVTTSINGVTTEACKAALSTYLTAKAQNKQITVSYSGTCTALNGSTSIQSGFTWFGVYWE